MIVLGTFLLYALAAGLIAWLVELVFVRIGTPGWLVRIVYGAALVYTFWFFSTGGVIRVGR